MSEDQRLASAWIAMHYAEPKSKAYNDNFWAFEQLSTLCDQSPHRCWQLIGTILKIDDSDKVISNLAAGPLEDLLVKHGHQFIEAVEKMAEQNAKFRKMLGAVWQNDIAEDVWARVQRVAGPSF